ncbi:MAG: TolC family protein [Leptospiraceae bacterium]|nr:TolC family protein [Leptospiraceae bacterium]
MEFKKIRIFSNFSLFLSLLGALTFPILGQTKPLKLEEAVKYVLENNLTVKNAKLEVAKTLSPQEKNESKFVWKVYGDITSTKINNPFNQNNIFSGTKISNDKIAVGIERDFKTGTYFALEASTVRFDSNAFEGPIGQAFGFSNLAIPPLYTGALSIKLSQELWKYSFGKVEKNKEKILLTQAEIERDKLVLLLTQVVAKVLVDFWTLAIYESASNTYEKLVKNARFILNITYQKQRIGTADGFEINLWTSILRNMESMYEKSKLDEKKAFINLTRILGVDPKTTSVSGVTELKEEIPKDISYEKDLEYALRKRIELRNLKKAVKVAKLTIENSEEEDAPSIKVTASYNTIGQTLTSPQDNFFNTNLGVFSLRYPEKRIDITVKYPLDDIGLKASIADAKVSLAQLSEQEKDLIKEISTELQDRIQAIESSYKAMKTAQRNVIENQRYYNGLVEGFQKGRFPALQVKTGLDNLAVSELQYIQAKVNFNINLLRYEIAKNSLFDKYGIDPDKVIEEIIKQANEFGK